MVVLVAIWIRQEGMERQAPVVVVEEEMVWLNQIHLIFPVFLHQRLEVLAEVVRSWCYWKRRRLQRRPHQRHQHLLRQRLLPRVRRHRLLVLRLW
jgi:hypothetical protein